MHKLCLALTFSVVVPLTAIAAAPDEILVGVNYFAGWWKPLPNKWHDVEGKDWRPRLPGRVPLLGEYNTRGTMDAEIQAAARYGVDFFAILWYYNRDGKAAEPNSLLLERGLMNFMHSPHAHRMRFMVESCRKGGSDA